MYINPIKNDLGNMFTQDLPWGQRTPKNQTCGHIQELHVDILPIQEGLSGQKCGETCCQKEYQFVCVCILIKLEYIPESILRYSTEIEFFVCDFFSNLDDSVNLRHKH